MMNLWPIKPPTWSLLAAWGALIFGAGCGGSTPQTRHYQLEIRAEKLAADTRPRPVLTVNAFSVDAAYDQPQIAYRESPFRIDHYYYHRWAALPGRLVSDAMRRGYQATGLFKTVLSGASGRSDAVLSGHISAIEEVDTSQADWRGHLVLELRLRDAGSGALLWSEIFDEEAALREQSPAGLADALSQILSRIVARSAPDIARLSAGAASPKRAEPAGRPESSGVGKRDPVGRLKFEDFDLVEQI